MGETTAIAWTDHTFNPWMGCSKVSPGCDHCYAEALGKRTGRVEWGDDVARVVTSDGYWRNALKWNRQAEAEGRRHRVFCASMADVFEDRDELIPHRARLFELIADTPWLDWQLLTKRPENVLDLAHPWDHWKAWPTNAWLGVTAENQEMLEERLPHACATETGLRFVSYEPALGPLDITGGAAAAIDWLICGGESGPGYRPLNLDWARSIRDQCVAYGIPFFFKQVGGRTPKAGGDELDGETWKQFPRTAQSEAEVS